MLYAMANSGEIKAGEHFTAANFSITAKIETNSARRHRSASSVLYLPIEQLTQTV
ncbi:hypothetical protein PL9631_110062 [Planktothrix paucivesiculata PCC 9631]|uniref:Uncharacterized protein n=2 Tax=Planktothrix TaxID=54304 RepID=A0A7Z9BMT6_9CYAN|nr:hypothetical protein PL9631_110062 [Planktothrix paucivesiculata PCC 9631]